MTSILNGFPSVGEKPGRPFSSLAKRDGKAGMIDITRRQRTRHGGAGGVSGQMAKNVKV